MIGKSLVLVAAAGVGGLMLAGLVAVPVEAQAPAASVQIHHIHGLAFDWNDPETVLIATHTGLLRLRPPTSPEWVGEHRFDLMGFTVDPRSANLVYASGHPDLATYRREKVGNLGLLVSRDGGGTWQSVALGGHADFHALALSPRDGGVLYGWSVAGQTGLHRISTKTWTAEAIAARGLAEVIALSASPDAGGLLLAGTPTGLFASRDGGLTWSPVRGLPGAPVTAVAHHSTDARLVHAYVHRAGTGLMRSRDGGATWEAAGLFTGPDTPVIALAVGPGEHVVTATTQADVTRSRDGGRTWTAIVRHGRPVAASR